MTGFSAAILIVVIGAFLFIDLGGVSMATKSPPLPLEASVARLALHASFAGSEKRRDPLPLTEANMAAGAKLYSQPISDSTLIVVPVNTSIQSTPARAPGTAIMMMNGSSQD
jgi:hypothetical protein